MMAEDKTETPTGNAADEWLKQKQANKKSPPQSTDDFAAKVKAGRLAKKKLRQDKVDAVAEAEIILYAPEAPGNPTVEQAEKVTSAAEKLTEEIGPREAQTPALTEAYRVLSKASEADVDPLQAIRVHLKGTHDSDPKKALQHLKAIQSLLASQVEIPNRENIEEETRIRAQALYLKKLGQKGE